jgi:polyisoprenoid-binding protein YceI
MAWTIDPSHSQIQFAVRHMMISNVRGRFEDFTGTVDFDENDLSTLAVDVSIDTASINTRDEKRDEHLRSADFFNTAEFPTMAFRSTSVEKVSDNTLKLHGDLTIAGVTRPVTLDVEYSGTAVSPWGTTSAGFSAQTKINRKEWGLVWNGTLEAGGVLVGEDIKIELDLELVKEQVEVAAVA